MQAAAHSPEFAKKAGISRSVAKEWSAEDEKRGTDDLPTRRIAKALRGENA
jgi:transposase